MNKLLVVLAAVLMTACMQEQQADLEGLEGMRDVWQSAFEAKDAAAVAALYAEDGEVLPPNGEPIKGRDAIEAFWEDFMASGLSGEIQDREAYAHGDVGYKVGIFTMNDPAGMLADEGKYVEIWRNVDGQWLLHRDIYNSSRPADAAGNRVVVTATVADTAEWEKGFRTHGDLFKSMSLSKSHYATTEDNRVAVYTEPTDLDLYLEVLKSPATAEAMESDGIDRDTVEVFVLDKEFDY